MTVLNTAQKERIRRRVADLERNTSGEVIIATLERSQNYDNVRALVAFTVAIVAVTAWHLFNAYTAVVTVGDLSFELEMSIMILSGVLTWYALPLGPLLRRVAKAMLHAAVLDRAFALFAREGVHQTRDKTGVLVLISELEHAVQVLADTGIHEKLGQEQWNTIVDRIVKGLKSGQLEENLMESLDDLEQKLAQHFPPRSDDTNELPNHVIDR